MNLNLTFNTVLLCLLLSLACSSSPPSSPSTEDEASLTLVTTTSAIDNPQDFKGRATLVAGKITALNYNGYAATIPSLSIEVKNEQGDLIPHLPPPVPNPEAIEAGKKSLEQAETTTFEFEDLAISPSFMPTGTYSVRMSLETSSEAGESTSLFSNWVKVEVR